MSTLFCFKSRFKWKYVIVCGILLYFLDFMGVFKHFAELDYSSSFEYPYTGNIKEYIAQVRRDEIPKVLPINLYDYRFLSKAENKCKNGKVRLVYLVKSAAAHADRRQAIRNTWGYERRFSDVVVQTVFLVGMVDDADVLLTILHEREIYQDIVQVDFVDSYYNNTIKTMSGIKWAVQQCSEANYYYFSDDDMYVSTKNILRFVRNPVEYPQYLKKSHVDNNRITNNIYNVDLPSNVLFYAGYVFNSSPMRHKISKWYVSLEEYPYDMWPPYVTAGGFLLSREALHLIYYGSMYTKHFRFDDIFLGLVAQKVGIEVFHCDEFYFHHKPYSINDYQYVITSHGFENPNVLVKVWNEQKSNGNA